MKERIIEIVQKIKNKHIDDPSVYKDKDQIVEILLLNIEDSINILNNLDEDTLEWISSRFEDLSYRFQNEKFIECLKNLLIKFPHSEILKQDIQDAIESFGNEN